jgi:molybdenum cofactor guanylyltransferase
MGADKAFVEVDGMPLVLRCVQALDAAGAERVEVVGGDHDRLHELKVVVVPDLYPGEGPLGALLTALARHDPDQPVVVVPCDLREPSAAAIAETAAALEVDAAAAAAVPEIGGRRAWLHAAWRPAIALPVLGAAFAGGTRAVWRAAEGLDAVLVGGIGVDAVDDLDRPGDLPPNSHPGPDAN